MNVARLAPGSSTRTRVASAAVPVVPVLATSEEEDATLVRSSPFVPVPTLVRERPPAGGRRHVIFREEAIAAHLASMRSSEVVRIAPPWSVWIMLVGALVVVSLVASTFVLDVDQTSHARGVLRVAGGAHSVVSQAGGTVLELGARSGETVREGALLARIDSTPTKTAILETDRQSERAERDIADFVARRDKEEASRVRLLQQRAAILSKRVQSQRASIARADERSKTFGRLHAEGLASTLDKGAAEGDVATAERGALELEEQISATHLQIAGIAAELAAELSRRQAELQKARDHREALVLQLAQTEIRAPRAGRIEAMVVKVGDAIALGAPVARLVPEGAPREVVVFLPEKDRAFLEPGAKVPLELDQLPTGEFGTLHGAVVRIASDLATHAEVSDVLGDVKPESPGFRVELALDEDAATGKLERMLRPGSYVTARFHLRKRRLAPVLFQPLRRIFE